MSLTNRRTDERTKILVSNIGYLMNYLTEKPQLLNLYLEAQDLGPVTRKGKKMWTKPYMED